MAVGNVVLVGRAVRVKGIPVATITRAVPSICSALKDPKVQAERKITCKKSSDLKGCLTLGSLKKDFPGSERDGMFILIANVETAFYWALTSNVGAVMIISL